MRMRRPRLIGGPLWGSRQGNSAPPSLGAGGAAAEVYPQRCGGVGWSWGEKVEEAPVAQISARTMSSL